MFSTKEFLVKRTGKNKVGRFKFLKLLVNEYNSTKSIEAKQQVIANLANFAYDPINYEYLRNLLVIDLFLDELENRNEKIVEFCLGGLCNLCLDPLNKEYIVQKRGISVVSKQLFSANEEIVLNAITTLMFLTTPQTKPEITNTEIVECMVTYLRSESGRIRNLATVFLEDYCTKYQVKEAKKKVDKKLGPLMITRIKENSFEQTFL